MQIPSQPVERYQGSGVAAITQQIVQQYQFCLQMDVFFPVCFQGACVMVQPASVTCCQFWILYSSGESAEEVALG